MKRGFRKPNESGLPEISPRERALLRLGVREYSAAEMKSYLKRKGVSPEDAEKVVCDLIEENLIRDERYSRVVVRAQAMRDKGPGYIMGKLRSKGVKVDIRKTREIFNEVAPDDEVTMARRVLERRYPNARGDRKEAQRAYQALMRRGFSQEAIKKCLFSSGLPDADSDDSDV